MGPRLRYLAFSLVVCLFVVCGPLAARGEAAGPSVGTRQPNARAGGLLFDLPTSGSIDSVFAALGVAPPPRATAVLSLIRLLHSRPATADESRRVSDAIDTRLGPGARSPASSQMVPLPLSPDVWTSAIFGGKVTSDQLLYAILRDRAASLLYYGLMSVDDDTLEYFDAHRDLLTRMYEQGVGPFATCARSLRVEHDVVVLPGGDAALPAWEAIVGERASAPGPFIMALVGGDQGRRAYFLDVVTHLDPARQAFALAASAPPERRKSLVRDLYDTVVQFERKFWRVDVWPFARQAADPAIVLMQVEATPDGRMKAPSGIDFWRAALDGNEGACAKLKPEDAATSTDAAWLVARLMREPTPGRQTLLSSVLFAQRVFSSMPGSDARSACQVVAGFGRYNGLMMALERVGVSNPRDYAGALQLARALSSHPDERTSILGISQMQGTLALLARMAATSPRNRLVAQELARSLFALPAPANSSSIPASGRPTERAPSAASLSLDRLADWMKKVLLPRLCGPEDSADVCLQGAATGAEASDASRTIIEWEEQRYRVEPATAANRRLSEVRDRQGAVRFNSALELFALGLALRDAPFSRETAAQQALRLQDLAGSLDPSVPLVTGGTMASVGSQLEHTAKQLASARQKPASAAAEVLDASQVLLADAWASFAYAMAIGDVDSSFLLADDPARHHDFGISQAAPLNLAPAWRLAQEEYHRGTGWQIRGSLLGLEQACALSWPRRLSNEAITTRPTLTELDVHGFAQSAAALDPFALTDAGRASLAAAIRRGRELLGTLTSGPQAFAARAAAAGVSEWRIRAAVWSSRYDADAVDSLFSLTELLWLGGPNASREQIDAWGVPSGPFDGSLGVRMPRGHAWEDVGGRGPGNLYSYVADLHLRVALWLDEMNLPAELMPGIVSFATWDLTTTAQPVDMDDYLGVARAAQAIPADRFADYLSALTTDGTLAPLPKR